MGQQNKLEGKLRRQTSLSISLSGKRIPRYREGGGFIREEGKVVVLKTEKRTRRGVWT